MIEKRADCRTNPGTADTRRHIVFLRVLEQSGALFLCPECRSVHPVPSRWSVSRGGNLCLVILLQRCFKPLCAKRYRLVSHAPVSGVRVMGCVRGRGRGGYGRWSGRERSGALRYRFCSFWRGCYGMVLRSGLVRQSVRFASDRHIVSRDNCYYSEILLDCGELFRD